MNNWKKEHTTKKGIKLLTTKWLRNQQNKIKIHILLINKTKIQKRNNKSKNTTHSPQRQGREPASHNEPNPAIANKVLQSSDEHRRPKRQNLAERAGEKPYAIPQILCDAKRSKLALVIAQRCFDYGRDAPK